MKIFTIFRNPVVYQKLVIYWGRFDLNIWILTLGLSNKIGRAVELGDG